MAGNIKVKKGLDIPLEGKLSNEVTSLDNATLFAIVPDDFPGWTWKAVVKPGDSVRTGSPLLYAKENPQIHLVSPVAGVVKEIHRGERRHIEFISISKSGHQSQEEFNPGSNATREEITEILCKSGLWGLMRQRPFDIIPSPGVRPRDIFVTAFDSAPLAANWASGYSTEHARKGIEMLATLTDGKVYVSFRKGEEFDIPHADIYTFEGPHPAGNTGTQINAIAPVNKGETIWTLDIITAARIGRLFADGVLDTSTMVALTGSEIKTPHLVNTTIGVSLAELLHNMLKQAKGIRVISGNVLTGTRENPESGFLRYPYRQVTAIPEGDNADEFMGWASLKPSKYSTKRTFPNFLHSPGKPFGFDARIKGGRRAMILSGEYDKVFPLDIYPEYLLKAMMAGDIEKMEQLGVYEVAPEDFALPEFVDTSKIEIQKIVRNALDYLRKETV